MVTNKAIVYVGGGTVMIALPLALVVPTTGRGGASDARPETNHCCAPWMPLHCRADRCGGTSKENAGDRDRDRRGIERDRRIVGHST